MRFGRKAWSELIGYWIRTVNDKACVVFVEFIAQKQREAPLDAVSKAKFFSIQADGTTGKVNIKEEMFCVAMVYSDFQLSDMKV